MPQKRQSGKLAVILHADIAGSTELVRQDEHLAHERIQNTFRRFSQTITKYHGQVRELRGDALLAEFERASDAVSAALAFQDTQSNHSEQLEGGIQPKVRVGIAIGEVIIADATVTGAGVVLAQRVERLADPGAVCVTSAIHEALPERMPFLRESLGEKEIKGFEEAIRVYRVALKSGETAPPPAQAQSPRGSNVLGISAAVTALILVIAGAVAFWSEFWTLEEEPASVERMAFPLPDKPSIAVLPFTNMSGDTEQEYFVDGMTEDLITDLSKLPGLFVIARNSVFTYKGKPVKVRQVSEELGVRYVLEGSVRRVGDQVRINAQLIDATTGGHLWADRYDGSVADVFTLQDKVTLQIVDALALNLTGAEAAATPKTVSAQAYDAFLKGWSHYQRYTSDDLTKAIPYLEQAIQLDEDYAQAHAALAAVYWEVWSNGWAERMSMSSADVMAKAKQQLENSMKEATPLAHWVASNIEISEGNYRQAVSEAQKIVALDSNNSAGFAQLANALELAGESEESADVLEKAIRLDPYASPLHAAVRQGDEETVDQLISDGVNVDRRDHYGNTPLHVAVETGQVGLAESLIEAGADLELRTPVSSFGGLRDRGSTSLMLAVRLGHTDVANALISFGADVNTADLLFDSWSVLHYAASEGYLEIVKLLIDNGADTDGTSANRRLTPLFRAVRNGHESTAALLIDEGADVNAIDADGSTPLHSAVMSGDSGIVQLLLSNGANANSKTLRGASPGETPLHITAQVGSISIAELLLASGVDIDAADQYGHTPLRRAVDQGNTPMVELLIEKGADTKTKDGYGVTPLHVVAQTGNVRLAQLLISSGADINAQDDNLGFTPLDYAQDGEMSMIKTLERHGAKCTGC